MKRIKYLIILLIIGFCIIYPNTAFFKEKRCLLSAQSILKEYDWTGEFYKDFTPDDLRRSLIINEYNQQDGMKHAQQLMGLKPSTDFLYDNAVYLYIAHDVGMENSSERLPHTGETYYQIYCFVDSNTYEISAAFVLKQSLSDNPPINIYSLSLTSQEILCS